MVCVVVGRTHQMAGIRRSQLTHERSAGGEVFKRTVSLPTGRKKLAFHIQSPLGRSCLWNLPPVLGSSQEKWQHSQSRSAQKKSSSFSHNSKEHDVLERLGWQNLQTCETCTSHLYWKLHTQYGKLRQQSIPRKKVHLGWKEWFFVTIPSGCTNLGTSSYHRMIFIEGKSSANVWKRWRSVTWTYKPSPDLWVKRKDIYTGHSHTLLQ